MPFLNASSARFPTTEVNETVQRRQSEKRKLKLKICCALFASRPEKVQARPSAKSTETLIFNINAGTAAA